MTSIGRRTREILYSLRVLLYNIFGWWFCKVKSHHLTNVGEYTENGDFSPRTQIWFIPNGQTNGKRKEILIICVMEREGKRCLTFHVHHHDDYLFVFLCTRLLLALWVFPFIQLKYIDCLSTNIIASVGFRNWVDDWMRKPCFLLFIISLPFLDNLNIHIINKRFISSTFRNTKFSESHRYSIQWENDEVEIYLKKLSPSTGFEVVAKRDLSRVTARRLTFFCFIFLWFFLATVKWKRREVSERENWK